MPEELTKPIDWFGHASFRIRGTKTIYIDPWKIKTAYLDGDLIFITHSHYDHFSVDDIKKAAKPEAIIVAPASMKSELSFKNVVLLKPGENVTLAEVGIEAIRSYNTNKKFHPKSNNWLGYVINLDGVRYYHAGDTDLIEEMKAVSCDVAMLPVSGVYVMTAKEAILAAQRIGPKVAIPMHWGDIVGGKSDAEQFAAGAPCPVVIKEPIK